MKKQQSMESGGERVKCYKVGDDEYCLIIKTRMGTIKMYGKDRSELQNRACKMLQDAGGTPMGLKRAWRSLAAFYERQMEDAHQRDLDRLDRLDKAPRDELDRFDLDPRNPDDRRLMGLRSDSDQFH